MAGRPVAGPRRKNRLAQRRGDDPAASREPARITMARARLGGPALAAALALVFAADRAAACPRPESWSGGAKLAGTLWTAWCRPEPAPIPVGAHFSIRFHLLRAASRTGSGARLDAGPPARHELPPGGDPERLVRNGRGPAVPHAGPLAAHSGYPRRGGPGDADRRNGAGMTPRRPGVPVAARLAGLAIAVCMVSGIPMPAPALDFTAGEKRRILRHGPWPPVPAPDPSNRVSGKPGAIAFGRALFFDPRLSISGRVSCATCHAPDRAWTDGLPRSRGHRTVDRNALSLFNLRFNRWFGWDGAQDTLWAQKPPASARPARNGRRPGRRGAAGPLGTENFPAATGALSARHPVPTTSGSSWISARRWRRSWKRRSRAARRSTSSVMRLR